MKHSILLSFVVLLILLSSVTIMRYAALAPTGEQMAQKVLLAVNSTSNNKALKEFLKENQISFSEARFKESPPADSIFQVANQFGSNSHSYISIRIHNVERRLCGRIDNIFVVVYAKNGSKLGHRTLRIETGCLDF